MRKAAEQEPALVGAVLDSMSPVKIVLSDIIGSLKLKGKSFELFIAASQLEIEDVWN